MKYLRYCVVIIACLCFVLSTGYASGDYRTVIDSRGIAVQVPTEIDRVVTVSDGMVEGVMTRLGVEDTLVGLGSSCLVRVFEYEYPTVDGKSYSYKGGMNPVYYLNPSLSDLPLIGKSGTAVNYETLASLEPDLIIVRLGSCTLRYIEDETVQKTIESIESLEIPLVVLYGPNCYSEPTVSGISDEIHIMGQIFDKEDEATELADYLQSQVDLIEERTNDISDSEKPRVLVFGLSPRARSEGGAGQVFGMDTIESFFIEDLVNACNAFQEPGYFKTMSAEQILALNPDVIVLCTASGYHPPRELYEAPYYQNLQELDALKNRRVMAFPWTPCNCAKRLEYPIDVMVIAKAAYPERFEDIDISKWLLDFYQNVYGVDLDTAEELRSCQWMDWTVEESSS
jgi:iron complex transport system substrate-binding protein